MMIAYFFATPVIDYTKLIDAQAKVKSVDIYKFTKKR